MKTLSLPGVSRGRTSVLLTVVMVAVVGIVTYLPAVDNFFISDDFTMFQTLDVLESAPGRILEIPSELFRVASYVFFRICLQLFGLNAAGFYWAGIALHVAVSLLVYVLVRRVSGNAGAGAAAALFFAAYERHQEAVMWISAYNDTILAFNSLLFLVVWERVIAGRSSSILGGPIKGGAYWGALALFGVALFSKEAAVALAPLAAFRMLSAGYSTRETLRTMLPLCLVLTAFGSFWLYLSTTNFFVVDGHYAFGPHFFSVYLRSVSRLLAPALAIAAPLLWPSVRRSVSASGRRLLSGPGLPFFALFLILSVAPYCFLTYMDHIPSRNTYLPSVGLAGMAGLLFASIYRESVNPRIRAWGGAFMALILAGNVGYIWFKKEPQFQARSAPTKQLIDAVNRLPETLGATLRVCGFPLHRSIGRQALQRFTRLEGRNVHFMDRCDEFSGVGVLRWDAERQAYTSDPEILSGSAIP